MKISPKIISVILPILLVVAFVFSPYVARASWPDVGVMGTTTLAPILETYVYTEVKEAVISVLKQRAMQLFRDQVYDAVGESGSLVLNWGQYLYAAGDSAAAKYWNSFLANCTNIDTTISLAVKYTAVDRKQSYNWCPVKVNARGVDLGEVDISEERGWEDFTDMVTYNNSFITYYQAVDDVETARQQMEETQKMSALSGGLSSTTTGDVNDTSPETSSDGGPQLPAESENMNIDTYLQKYLDTLSAATAGTFQVQANTQGILASVISMALNKFIDQALGSSDLGSF